MLLRERLRAGDSDAAARQYIVARYGDFVLLKPPLETATLALWFGPALVFVIGGLGEGLVGLPRRHVRAYPRECLSVGEHRARVCDLRVTIGRTRHFIGKRQGLFDLLRAAEVDCAFGEQLEIPVAATRRGGNATAREQALQRVQCRRAFAIATPWLEIPRSLEQTRRVPGCGEVVVPELRWGRHPRIIAQRSGLEIACDVHLTAGS